MSNVTQQKLIEDPPKKQFIFPQPERTCEQDEEIDCKDKNIVISNYKNTLLSLTLNRSSQQIIVKKYDQSMSDHIRDVKLQMRNEFFVMSPNRCVKSLKKKALLSINSQGYVEKVKYTNQNCNSWTCPHCAPIKAKAICHQISEIANINYLIYYLTLTLDPNKLLQEDLFGSTHKIITGLFNHFVTVVKRKSFSYFNKSKNKLYKFSLKNSKEKLKYVWVIEFQDNGLAHMHILLNQFLPIEVIRKVWTHVGGGHIMKIERARNIQAVSNYITKYITKSLNDSVKNKLTFRFFERRYSISLSCKKPPKYSRPMFNKKDTDFDIQMKLRKLNLSFVYDKLGESQHFPNFE